MTCLAHCVLPGCDPFHAEAEAGHGASLGGNGVGRPAGARGLEAPPEAL